MHTNCVLDWEILRTASPCYQYFDVKLEWFTSSYPINFEAYLSEDTKHFTNPLFCLKHVKRVFQASQPMTHDRKILNVFQIVHLDSPYGRTNFERLEVAND